MVAPSHRQTGRDDAPLPGARVLIVEARFYEDLADELLRGAQRALAASRAAADVLTVPGALEIPPALAIALDAAERAGRPYEAAVALGCVVRGETGHYDIVAGESARALMELTTQGFAIGNGILTVENEAQAIERADPNRGDKGGDAARAALALYELREKFGA